MTKGGSREQFFTKLHALYREAQSPDLPLVAKATGISVGTLKGWFGVESREPRVPRTDKQFKPLLEFLLHRTGKTRITQHEINLWAELRSAAYQRKRKGPAALASSEVWAGLAQQLGADRGLPWGRDLDPYQLGATPTQFGQAGRAESAEDPYLPRTARKVDAEIDAALDRQGMVLITGPSKAGKTRSLFEAVRRKLPDARILVPDRHALHLIPNHPGFVGSTDTIVVWLDDVQKFFATDNPLTLTMLAHLTARSAQTVVVATLRSEALDRLTHDTSELTHDIRALLEQAHKIEIASTSEDADEQAAAAALYPSLQLELHSPDSEQPRPRFGLAEVLAGAPALLRQYDVARFQDPPLHAVIQVAIDWARIGRFDAIPERTLSELALAATDIARCPNLSLPRIEAAISTAREPAEETGYTSALIATLLPDGGIGYRPFDYLVAADDGEHQRTPRPIPRPFWRTATDGAETAIRNMVAITARLRDETDEAMWLWRCAADAGEPTAMYNLGSLSRECGRDRDAETWYRRAAETGEHQDEVALDAIERLAALSIKRGDIDEAISWYRRAADRGAAKPMLPLAALLRSRGDTKGAEDWLRRAAGIGDTTAMVQLGAMLRDRGDSKGAEASFRRAAEIGDPEGMSALGVRLYGRGETTESEYWLRRGAEAGCVYAETNLGVLLAERGDEDAEMWLRRGANSWEPTAMINYAVFLRDRGDTDEANKFFNFAYFLNEYPGLRFPKSFTEAVEIPFVLHGQRSARNN
ncbi:SEL1-like repeat protein [Nocardia barduliensis]|uniref:SEL1-like repeat protein n=1 Tax=Nocardia barduliensis TaxID=2736643 RepID=UPI0015746698|nr:tetratricopeptide repeat protein [Nocardia barduliensis]